MVHATPASQDPEAGKILQSMSPAWATVQNEFQVSLGYRGRSYLKKEKKKGKHIINVLLM